ncbi:hypothetical protein BJY59DRAFT_55995 [Rhodotorula toruloides]
MGPSCSPSVWRRKQSSRQQASERRGQGSDTRCAQRPLAQHDGRTASSTAQLAQSRLPTGLWLASLRTPRLGLSERSRDLRPPARRHTLVRGGGEACRRTRDCPSSPHTPAQASWTAREPGRATLPPRTLHCAVAGSKIKGGMARCDSSFVAVPYRTPSASPDRSAIHSKPAMTAVVAAPPAPTTVHNAAPPSPPLGPISALALFAAEMFVWLWFAPTSGGAGVGEAATPEDGAGLARLQVKPTDRFLRFCHEVLSTSEL